MNFQTKGGKSLQWFGCFKVAHTRFLSVQDPSFDSLVEKEVICRRYPLLLSKVSPVTESYVPSSTLSAMFPTLVNRLNCPQVYGVDVRSVGKFAWPGVRKILVNPGVSSGLDSDK